MGGEFTYQPKWDPIGFDPKKVGDLIIINIYIYIYIKHALPTGPLKGTKNTCHSAQSQWPFGGDAICVDDHKADDGGIIREESLEHSIHLRRDAQHTYMGVSGIGATRFGMVS